MEAIPWLLLQLADSAFPTGGFAHSSGLEAAVQLGEVSPRVGLEPFVRASLWQTGYGTLPFVRAAHRSPEDLPRIDRRCDVFLLNPVANRASRTQGRAFVGTCARAFGTETLNHLEQRLRSGALQGHHAPCFGAALQALGVSERDALQLTLHSAVRAVLSAAVRLGVSGPFEAQRLQARLAPELDRVLATCAALELDDAAQPAPLYDLLGSLQDRLYSRLFQS